MSFDQLDFSFSRLPLRKRFNLVAQGVHLMCRSRRRFGFPVIVQVEPTNQCNLGCLTCPTGARLMKRPVKMMPFEMYRSIIDQIIGYAYLLVFWSWGEPFIHPDACRMIRYAKDSGLQVHTSTNGHFFHTPERARAVVASGLDSVIIAVDGLDPLTYQAYRKGGDFNRVVSSIENLVAAKQALGVFHPRIAFRFIVMKHNEHQIQRVVPFAKNLGVDAVSFRSVIVQRSNINLEDVLTPIDEAFQLHGYGAGAPSNSRRIQDDGFYCHRPYANLTIFSNGDVVACENDYNATLPFGNVGETPLQEVLSSSRAEKFFRVFRENSEGFDFCRCCDLRDLTLESHNLQTHVFADGCQLPGAPC